MQVTAYLQTLSSFSSQTLSAACESFRKRSTRFPPTAGEVFQRCEEIIGKEKINALQRLPYRSEAQTKMEKIKERSPESYQRVSEMYESFKSSAPPVSNDKSKSRLPTKAEAEDWVRAHENGVGLPKVVVTAEQMNRLWPQEAAE
jgi:hypothetical protein